MHNKVTKRMHLKFYLIMFALKYEHFSEVEGAPDDRSEGTPTFEVEIQGALEDAIELHMKMHMVVRLLVQNNSQNNSIKGELEEALYVGNLRFHFKKHEKLQKNVKRCI